MNTVEFAGLELLAAPGLVMTPRATSLALIEHAVQHLGDAPGVAVDVGTGSGAVAIAIARAAPRATVWATDVSAAAVALARRNAIRCGVEIEVRRGHLLDPVTGEVDVVVANLPYLPSRERPLHPELETEPPAAVYAPGDGLGSYRLLLADVRARLAPGGLIAAQLRRGVVAARGCELRDVEPLLAAQAA